MQPRRRNAARTKERILAVAFDLFASRGYARTGIRDIGEGAGVASSLLLRHFGSKSNLFKEVLVHALYTRGFFVRERAEFGVRMARLLTREKDVRITALLMLAIADDDSRAVAQEISRRVIVASLAEWLGPPDAEARAVAMLSLMNGFVLQTQYLTADDPPAGAVAWLAKALQAVVDDA